MMNFLEKLDYLMEKRSINKSKLSKMSGVPYTTIDGFYKKGYENTKLSTIRKLSEALNVSLDYLFDETLDDKSFSAAQTVAIFPDQLARIIEIYNKMNQVGQEKLYEYAEDLFGNDRYKKSDTISEETIG